MSQSVKSFNQGGWEDQERLFRYGPISSQRERGLFQNALILYMVNKIGIINLFAISLYARNKDKENLRPLLQKSLNNSPTTCYEINSIYILCLS